MRGVSALLEIHGLALQRAGGFACRLPELCLRAGECASLVGPSGSGKSSLLRAMFGLRCGDGVRVTGETRAFGEPWPLDPKGASTLLRTRVAFVAQDARAAMDPTATVAAQIARAAGCDVPAAAAALAAFGVPAGRRHPHASSGGELQRALFAVATLRGAALMACDEPTAHLDDASCMAVANAIATHCARGGAAIVATHDERLLAALPTRRHVAHEGAFVEGAPAATPWPSMRAAMPRADEPVLTAKGLAVRRGDATVFSGIDVALLAGRSLAVCGPSGVGKTTLARALVGRIQVDQGSVVRRPGCGLVALVSQDAAGSLTPGRTLRSLATETSVEQMDVAAIAQELGLADAQLDADVSSLSGGEARRGALLRALCADPSVLVLDEPTESLDRESALRVARALRRRCEERRMAVACVTHDREFATSFGDELLELRGNTA